jgi:hypothetical protein
MVVCFVSCWISYFAYNTLHKKINTMQTQEEVRSHYRKQIDNIHYGIPKPEIKLRDADGNETLWMHLTQECLGDFQAWLADNIKTSES